ncbi:5-hydroxytryptamine receptor 3A-like isoform X2 [Mastacembelus armatus]|uniref:5-hydroxytryptamine receptor 3A-like n=1 Tax=Mastacembelus armatus TaxID=205130 RepID=A0A3Q3SWH5_9TELE|nr:5-hydroxytryptamine receptor 3A-like isoform X2 [Mastacembelus armatus]
MLLSLGKTVFLLSLLTVGCGLAETICTSRRCLAQMLINKNFSSQPQYENCSQTVYVPYIEYQTLSVDTKNLRLYSLLQAMLVWSDPELSWNTSVYKYNAVVLPVQTVWIPELQVTNGIQTTMTDASRDLLVYSNGTLVHFVNINAEVDCAVNLFNYPFAADECPVAIQTWSYDECGTDLVFGKVWKNDGSHGDWQTTHVSLEKKRDDRHYIMVGLSIKYTGPFITLLLPTILIVLADVVSFALPVGEGERNGFKVTLVLSFTMFLGILNDVLPGDSECSPIIRTHFCVCLVLMVLSMLVSMVLTQVAKDGTIVSRCWPQRAAPKTRREEQDEENQADISVVKLGGSEDSQMLRKVVKFLDAIKAKELESERCKAIANRLDTIFFWFYFILGTVYFCAMTYVMVRYECKIDHFDFWN